MSGRHRKPVDHRRRNSALVITTGTFAAIPFTTGMASAATPHDGWAPLIRCESGGNPKAQNASSTASGLFQFLDSTWRSNGGGKYAKRAKDATVSQQYEIANLLLHRAGLAPWAASKRCWSGKTSVSAIKASLGSVKADVELAAKVSPTPSAPRSSTPPPASPPATSSPAQTPEPATKTTNSNYVVVPGDTLSGIGAVRGLSWPQVWEPNKPTVPNPDLIFPGQHLIIPGVGPVVPLPPKPVEPPKVTPAPSSPPQASPGGGGSGGKSIVISMTGYSFQDNTPANSNDICCGVIHQKAGGTGTFNDPITVAVPGHGGKNMEFPVGTKFYAPSLKRYLIVEDSGASDYAKPHLDVYVDGKGLPKSASDECMSDITGDKTVIQNPGPGYPVTVGALTASGGCRI